MNDRKQTFSYSSNMGGGTLCANTSASANLSFGTFLKTKGPRSSSSGKTGAQSSLIQRTRRSIVQWGAWGGWNSYNASHAKRKLQGRIGVRKNL